jgi:pimeloyl-ACP methyl ester carboxylesterase
MALVTVNAGADGLDADRAALAAALAALPAGAPVVVMIHGYRFMPGQPGHCPHEHILSLCPTPGVPRAVSWPDRLGLAGDRAGLAIAFGWPARGSLRDCYARADQAGAHLAELIARLRRLAPDRPVDVIAHSLGARVALRALPLLAPGDVGRMILLAGAELRGPAAAAMDTPAGRAAEVLNVSSRQNALFDLMLRAALTGGLSRSVGAGLARPLPNWTDLHIDRADTLAALASRGFPLAPPGHWVCHWSAYLRAGVFPLYCAILSGDLPLSSLRAALPRGPGPRRSARHRMPRLSGPRPTPPGSPA